MESPHMDPAVVMVHHTVPPPTTSGVAAGPPFNQIFIPPTTLAALQQQQQQHFTHFQQTQQKQGAPGKIQFFDFDRQLAKWVLQLTRLKTGLQSKTRPWPLILG